MAKVELRAPDKTSGAIGKAKAYGRSEEVLKGALMAPRAVFTSVWKASCSWVEGGISDERGGEDAQALFGRPARAGVAGWGSRPAAGSHRSALWRRSLDSV